MTIDYMAAQNEIEKFKQMENKYKTLKRKYKQLKDQNEDLVIK